jgi:carbonic anhydrase
MPCASAPRPACSTCAAPRPVRRPLRRTARATSNCPSGAEGGALGWLTADDCAPEFAREIFGKPEVGVLPRLVHSRFGLHVVEVLAREPGLDPAFEAVKSAVAQGLRSKPLPPRCGSTCSCWRARPRDRAWTWKPPSRRWCSSPSPHPPTPCPTNCCSACSASRPTPFPLHRSHFRHLVDDGQHPMTLFIGCSDSRLVPYLLTGAGPGELFLVRNVGAFVPPHDQSQGFHGTAAAIEFAVLNLSVRRIVVCGHSHCGAIRALYGDVSPAAKHLSQWLELGREAALPVAEPGPDVLRRTEQRAVVLQLERLMDYPMVRERVEAGTLALHGWHYVIEDGEVHVFDVQRGGFVPAAQADNAGTGPYMAHCRDHPAAAAPAPVGAGLGHQPCGHRVLPPALRHAARRAAARADGCSRSRRCRQEPRWRSRSSASAACA